MEKIRKTPQRMCMACRQMHDKRELLRIVRTPQGELQIDDSGRLAGRGAYLCSDPACLKKALRSHAIERALGVKPDETLAARLEAAAAAESDS